MSMPPSHALVRGALAPWLLLSLPLAAPALAGSVWVVDDDGGVGTDATSLQAAADDAVNGDTLLVRPGVYGALEIDGKSLVVVADGTGPVTLDLAQLWIHDLAAGQRVVVRGIDVIGKASNDLVYDIPLQLSSNQGHVWLEDCTFTNTDPVGPGNPVLSSVPGAVITNSASVTAVRCEFRGRKQVYTSWPFSWTLPGIHSTSSSLVIHDSLLEGSDGAGGKPCFGACPGTQGGPGLTLDGGFAFITNSTISGGQGLPGGAGTTLLNCGQGGHGGHGLMTIGTGPGSLTLVGSTVVPGAGGPGGSNPEGFTCSDGVAGLQVFDIAGIGVTSLPGPAPSAEVEATTTELNLATLTVEGQPGDYAYLFVSGGPNMNPLLGLSSVISIAPPQYPLTSIALDATGTGTIPLVAPGFSGAMLSESLTVYLQLAHVSVDLQLMLSVPTVWTVVASGI